MYMVHSTVLQCKLVVLMSGFLQVTCDMNVGQFNYDTNV